MNVTCPNCAVRIEIDDHAVDLAQLKKGFNCPSCNATVTMEGAANAVVVDLKRSLQRMKIMVGLAAGVIVLLLIVMAFSPRDNGPQEANHKEPLETGKAASTFKSNLGDWKILNGHWEDSANGMLGRAEPNPNVIMLSSERGSNFTYEAEMVIKEDNPTAGSLIFRASDRAHDQCYTVNISTEKGGTVKLFKLPYTVLGYSNQKIECDKTYHIKVVASGENIKVYFNGQEKPLIEANDASYAEGRFGLLSWQGPVIYQNVIVNKSDASLQKTETAGSIAEDSLQAPSEKITIIEGEDMKIISSKYGVAKKQTMKYFGNDWSRDRQLWWTSARPGESLEIALALGTPGKYRLRAVMTKAPDYGIVQLFFNGKKCGEPVDLYFPSVSVTEGIDLGIHELGESEHELQVVITGANPKAHKTYMFGLDCIKAELLD